MSKIFKESPRNLTYHLKVFSTKLTFQPCLLINNQGRVSDKYLLGNHFLYFTYLISSSRKRFVKEIAGLYR